VIDILKSFKVSRPLIRSSLCGFEVFAKLIEVVLVDFAVLDKFFELNAEL
jgi:hypothetical protein